MADKSSQIVLSALSRAVADPEGTPLHGNKTAPGLFPATTGGKQAAQRCLDEGYLRSLDTSPKPRCVLTEKGFSFLIGQVSAREVLADFVRAVEARHQQLDSLLTQARTLGTTLAGMKAMAEKVLQQVVNGEKPASLTALFSEFRKDNCNGAAPSNGQQTAPARKSPPSLEAAVIRCLTDWQASGAAEDCPLSTLFQRCGATVPGLTIGQFHDALRQLHRAEKIYLHPWTGPLYALPEPPCALLVGHEIAFYASCRN